MLEKSAVPYDTMSTSSVSTEPMFSKCCCCIPLRVGCFILGYLNLFVNTLRTLCIAGITLYYGITTHGFDHVDTPAPDAEPLTRVLDDKLQDMKQEDIYILGWSLAILTIFDLIWVMITIACLVGVHKKRPGPIRTYVSFATFRLILTMVGYMFQMNTTEGGNPHHVIAHCIDLGLTAYFILVYYIYAMKLQKEALQNVPQVPANIHDISYVYPTKLDKELLVA